MGDVTIAAWWKYVLVDIGDAVGPNNMPFGATSHICVQDSFLPASTATQTVNLCLETGDLIAVTHAWVTPRLDYHNALYVGLALKTVQMFHWLEIWAKQAEVGITTDREQSKDSRVNQSSR